MKRLKLLFAASVSIIFFLCNPLSAQLDESALSPTQPPRIPVTDYDTGPHRILDLMYMHYSFEEFDLDGGGIGFNYVNSHEKMAYNLGIGAMYAQGSSSSLPEDLDVYLGSIPLNGNIGVRLLGTPETSNLMVFGGIHWMYMWFVAVYGEYDLYIYGPVYGPLAGAKAEIKVTPSVSIIPYYVFQHSIFDITFEFEGIERDVDIDPVTSHLIGFDIKVEGFSVGAMLDMLNNTDNDRITILFTYDFDYQSGNEDLNRGDAQPEDKQKTKRPARKQSNVKQVQ